MRNSDRAVPTPPAFSTHAAMFVAGDGEGAGSPLACELQLDRAVVCAAIGALVRCVCGAAGERVEYVLTMQFYVGTYTRDTASEGVYRCELDTASGALAAHGVAAQLDNPAFLALDAGAARLYAVNEVSDLDGRQGGANAFAIEDGGALRPLGQQLVGATGPCHICTNAVRTLVFVACYAGSSVSVLRAGADGELGELATTRRHEGSSVNPNRQQEPHPHSVNLSPDGRYLYVPDLGIDQVVIYRIDEAADGDGVLQPAGAATVAAGAGPRHFAFHPNGRWAYVINELGSTVTAFEVDAASGALSELATASTLPDDFSGESTCADIHVHPNGRFLYGSNRGHDSIAIFTLDADGKPQPNGHQLTGGRTPRNFALAPSGDWLLAANQDSDSIHCFRVDPASGALEATGHQVSVPRPVCVAPVPGS